MTMTNEQTASAFYDLTRKEYEGKNASGSMNFARYRAKSYRTTMARIIIPASGFPPFVLLNRAHYSTTTTKHQGLYAYAASQVDVIPVYVFDHDGERANQLIDELSFDAIIWGLKGQERDAMSGAGFARSVRAKDQNYRYAAELREMQTVLRKYQAEIVATYEEDE